MYLVEVLYLTQKEEEEKIWKLDMSHVFDDKRVNRRNTGIYFISAL